MDPIGAIGVLLMFLDPSTGFTMEYSCRKVPQSNSICDDGGSACFRSGRGCSNYGASLSSIVHFLTQSRRTYGIARTGDPHSRRPGCDDL